jgi:hypothetical protein
MTEETQPSNEPQTQLVLVEAIQTYRMRYVVEVPVGKREWAEDTVAMDEAKEFSQLSLGETITSSRIISNHEMIMMCDEDNEYHHAWSDERKREMFVTTDDGSDDEDHTTWGI